jgi:methylated-DNA-protein-cysteine methyltransferase-like protein
LGRQRGRPDEALATPYARVYAAVKRIPRGRVATYGQIADLAGLAGNARQVGYALHALPQGTALPWQRVINARGQISRRADPEEARVQRVLLEDEGVRFDSAGRVPLARYLWKPRGVAAARGVD